MVGGGIAGLLFGYKNQDDKVLVFDRRRFPGKKCTGIISYSTFQKLGVPKEFIDSSFKEIRVIVDNKFSVYINTNVIRLNRENLEKWLSSNLNVIRPVNAIIKSKNEVLANNSKYFGDVIDASGWKGKAKWVKAIEEVKEPIDDDKITVYISSQNKGGFSWIVPLPDRTLVGALAYSHPELFIPKLDKKLIEIHGGSIPRTKPIKTEIKSIGDRTGIIKTFTGGGIFGIAELLNSNNYEKTLSKLSKEIVKQYYITLMLEKSWWFWLRFAKLFKDKTINAEKEFDFHSLLFTPH
nr:NAD(P)/FAD-dependent oxidoreductase [Acidianus sulfidivorans]